LLNAVVRGVGRKIQRQQILWVMVASVSASK
jgi:hypothetical protein